jgi:hypothetical protein
MATIAELRDALEEKVRTKLHDHANDADEAVVLRVDRWVDVFMGALRELAKARGLEVAPIRRGVGELGWELACGKNLSAGYAQLGSTPFGELFQLELILEVAENGLRPGSRPESAVEEACADLAKLIWARAAGKVLVFGARREKEPANAIDALEAGLTGLIQARDKESDYLLVALPNQEGARTVKGADAVLWTKIVSRGQPQPARTVKLFT